VSQLYPQAPGSLSITFCDSQGYGGGILTCLHTGSKYWYSVHKADQILAHNLQVHKHCGMSDLDLYVLIHKLNGMSDLDLYVHNLHLLHLIYHKNMYTFHTNADS
jgi:hypothetical protein